MSHFLHKDTLLLGVLIVNYAMQFDVDVKPALVVLMRGSTSFLDGIKSPGVTTVMVVIPLLLNVQVLPLNRRFLVGFWASIFLSSPSSYL